VSHSKLLGLIVALVLATIVLPAPGMAEQPSNGRVEKVYSPDLEGFQRSNDRLQSDIELYRIRYASCTRQPAEVSFRYSPNTSLHQAGLVVQFSNGNYLTRCIEFQEDEISGAELLRRSGLRVIMQISGGMGAAICKIEEDGCAYPDEPCFCQCRGGGQCIYWAYYIWNGEEWCSSGVGAGMRKLGNGDVDGWVWGSTDPPPIVSWDDVCDLARTSVGYPRVESGGNSLTITAPFRGDENGNGTASLRVRRRGENWDEPISMDREMNYYVVQILGLPDGHYETEVTYSDPDGLNGSSSWVQEAVVGTPMTYTLFIPIHFTPLNLELRGNAR